jgi:EAP30/Vps36 family
MGTELHAEIRAKTEAAIADFKSNLEAFALEHRAAIRADPEFRAQVRSIHSRPVSVQCVEAFASRCRIMRKCHGHHSGAVTAAAATRALTRRVRTPS